MFGSRLFTRDHDHAHDNGRRRELPRWSLIAVLVTTLISLHSAGAGPAYAAAGDLDPSFGGDGIVTTDVAGLGDEANGVAIQPDGKIIVAGASGTDFGLVRYHPDGTVDRGFGSGGTVTTDFSAGVDTARAVAIQPDGKIIAAGTAYIAGNDDVAVARYLPNGSPDTTFSTDGKVTTDFTGHPDGANSIAIQRDGKIVTAGRASIAGAVDFGLVRYTADGSPDATFGVGGKVSTDISGVFNQAFGIAIQPDGKIIAAGQVSVAQVSGRSDIALVRYLPNGRVDSRFGNGGTVTTDFGGFEQARGVAVHDGKIVIAGLTSTPEADFALARYLPDGRPDPAFGHGGTVSTDIAGGDDEALAVAIQRDGRIVAAGAATRAAQLDFGLARYLPDGRPDPAFGDGGTVTTDIAGDVDAANAVAIQPDGRTVAAGRAVVAGASDIAVARYRSATGCAHPHR